MYNHVGLLGRLAQKPEVKMTTSGKSVTSFDLAVNVPSKDPNTEPDYIPVVCWEKVAELVGRYLDKGRQIVVEGKIKTRKYTDSDGKNRKAVEVEAKQIYFADSGNRENNIAAGDNQQPTYSQGSPAFEELPDDGQLPF